MKKFSVTIQGISPLLMNRPSNLIADISKDKKGFKNDPKNEAEFKLYIDSKGKLYQPSTHISGALIEAGKHKKVVGKGKSTYSKIVGYAVEINPFEIEHKKQKWEIFSILAVNPNTKGRNLLHRPILKEWELEFEVIFDETEIPSTIMKELLDIAGRIAGLGDWRPQKKGRFGKFHVTKWKEIK
ncbi:MAG: hypothetical protein JSW08_00410 [archaeon]|nr:MAG: hypothetical protein JSW08_00410 [archaeon]